MSNITAGKVTTGDMITITGGGTASGVFTTTGVNTTPLYGSITSSSSISLPKASLDYLLDTYEMNQIVVEHKLQEQELMTLRTADVNFADHIKANLTKTTAEKIVQKMSFTKIKDPNMDVTSFRGRVWVFTKDELEQLIKDAQNA
jgi:hypothetical protein